MKLRLTTTLFALSALALGACSSGDDPLATSPESAAGDETITIGTANFPESEIIGQLWAAPLEAAGFDVAVHSGIGSREGSLQPL